MKIKELQDTCPLMTSDDYTERFKAEYYQLTIRLDKLKKMMDKWSRGNLEFTPTCPKEWYVFQIRAMENYKEVLLMRAEKENVKL